MASLLTAKNRKLSLSAQVQSLVRIGKRAQSKADFLRTEPGVAEYVEPGEIETLEAKARRAADEICEIVNANPDYPYWTLPQRRAAERYAR